MTNEIIDLLKKRKDLFTIVHTEKYYNWTEICFSVNETDLEIYIEYTPSEVQEISYWNVLKNVRILKSNSISLEKFITLLPQAVKMFIIFNMELFRNS